MKNKNFVLYTVYGEDELYYQGTIISILSLLNQHTSSIQFEIIVVSEKPELFEGLPVTHFKITNEYYNQWSLNGKYHYRIKNRALAFVMDELNIQDNDKILTLDTDTYFSKDISYLFNKINKSQSVMYLNEGPIIGHRYQDYTDSYVGECIDTESWKHYKISADAIMWGSLMVGLCGSHREHVEEADRMMLALLKIATVRTVEQFSISQALSRHLTIVEGKKDIKHYSHTSRKSIAKESIVAFFVDYKDKTLEERLASQKKLKLTRTFFEFLQQKIKKIFSKL